MGCLVSLPCTHSTTEELVWRSCAAHVFVHEHVFKHGVKHGVNHGVNSVSVHDLNRPQVGAGECEDGGMIVEHLKRSKRFEHEARRFMEAVDSRSRRLEHSIIYSS